ncbi:hypothetical protein TNCV_3877441 [Trichonephila clavipes]|uniref:Uncharacterized protein n=1 Tax=Trichonephila clavipes TaxID=2585209 RepID=A0A8X6T336_TRICX|nr:hypothetical protein TNCV_3877441 [Trichonephila clavipes]
MAQSTKEKEHKPKRTNPKKTFYETIVLQKVFEIKTRIHLEILTAMLHGIPDVLEGSSRQSFGRWLGTIGFFNTNPAGNHHLYFVFPW